MTESNSTIPPPAGKPAKPHPDFPLYPHASGRWAKKIKGTTRYFGKWQDGPEAALAKYLKERDVLEKGEPEPEPEALTVKRLCVRFLERKKAQREVGELSPPTFADYAATCKLLIKVFRADRLVDSLTPADFDKLRACFPATWGPAHRGNVIARVKTWLNFADNRGLLTKSAKRIMGEDFKKPSKAVLRQHRAAKGVQMFDADEIRRLLEAASPPLRPMILLACNTGFGNNDCATLPIKSLDLQRGWVNHPRPKTGVVRRAALWPETIVAINEWLTMRPAPKDEAHAGLTFLTMFGGSWVMKGPDSPLSKEMAKLLKRLGIDGRGSFYNFRRMFETIAGETCDQVAVDHVMGHTSGSMAAIYRQRIGDDRLQKVSEHVRAWLFALPAPSPEAKPALRLLA